MENSSFVLILDLMEGENRRAFDDSNLVDQAILWSFTYMLDWVMRHLGFSILSLFDFIDCSGASEASVLFF